MNRMRLVAISGSLRARSSNSALLGALSHMAPAGVEVVLYQSLGKLPHFNPDIEEVRPPESVVELRALIETSAGVLISSPEYAHGVPGTLKNALDWLVGAGELVGKPVAVINPSPHATHAHASLIETLAVMSWRVVGEACITVPLAGRRLDVEGIAADPELAAALRGAMSAFIAAAGGVSS